MNQLDNLFQRVGLVEIPTLPDDILVKIFEYVPPEDRLPLRLVCKRFRDLEFGMGNRTFEDVGVIMYADHLAIVAKMHSANCYCFETKADEECEMAVPGISKFFKNAFANTITFQVEKDREPKISHEVLYLLNMIAANEIYFHLYCESDFSGYIASFFETFNNTPLKGVTFCWSSLNDENVARLGEAMQKLPKLERLSLFEDKDNGSDVTENFLLNGALMLAMIDAASDVHLRSIQCTTQDLLNAFQIICEKSFHESVVLFVVESAAVDLLTVAKEQGFTVVEMNIVSYIIDKARKYIMFPTNHVSGKWHELGIRRIDKDKGFRDSDSDTSSDSDSDTGTDSDSESDNTESETNQE